MTVVGALRRGDEIVPRIELLLAVEDRPAALSAFPDPFDDPSSPTPAGAWDGSIEGVPLRLHFSPADQMGARLLYATGDDAHLAALEAIARGASLRLDRDGLSSHPSQRPIGLGEDAIYDALGLAWIPPELRQGDEALGHAREGALPRLIAHEDIRGDLHVHTNFSDGRDSVETMARAAAALGYEYVAITDHSPSSSASRNLSRDSLARQADAIAAAREAVPGLAILHGCEVDILADGSLDFDDAALEPLDIVLASLHEHHGHSADRLLDRYLQAMRHPLVALITHPTNRLLPSRAGYDLDYDHLFAAAAATGTLVEIDGGPAHLDLNGALARRAMEAGALLAVDSDCHRAERLGRQMRNGVTMARRGWVEPGHVINTRSLAAVRRVVADKRGT